MLLDLSGNCYRDLCLKTKKNCWKDRDGIVVHAEKLNNKSDRDFNLPATQIKTGLIRFLNAILSRQNYLIETDKITFL